jgi:hypothetical protein
MDADLDPTVAALAGLSDAELERLIAATYGVPQTAPGLLAWIDGACDWELNRRRGVDYPLQPPEAAIPPEEDSVSIDAAMAMRLAFPKDDRAEARRVLALFDVLVELLTGGLNRH